MSASPRRALSTRLDSSHPPTRCLPITVFPPSCSRSARRPALAVPRYLAARKKAYKAEADNVLQEAKTLEWAYYQQYNLFDTSGNSIGLVTPGNMHWQSPAITGTANGVVTMSNPLSSAYR